MTGAEKIGWTYRASALLFRAANSEIWQARYTWVFLQFCGDNYEELVCTRISNARGALDLSGTVGFFASAECVRGLDKKDRHFPYYSLPWRVGGDGVVKKIRFSEFMLTTEGGPHSGTTMGFLSSHKALAG